MKWGENLEFIAEAGPGGFIFVPPFVPHQEINALDDEPLECVSILPETPNARGSDQRAANHIEHP